MPKTETRVTVNGHAIRMGRLRLGMTQRALSDKTHELGDRADWSNIARAEQRNYGIGPAKLLVIAKALNVEVDDLLTVEELPAVA